jgi:transcriptional regulator with XRE-family HTH domain
MATKAVQQLEAEELLKRHRLHGGVYSRVAKKLGVDASYVSRVVRGDRKSDRIMAAVIAELRRIEGR